MEKSKEPSILLLPENSSIELNFQPYHFAHESAVFIASDQFVQTGNKVERINVNQQSQSQYRYLFSQVLSLGHVDIDEKIKSIGGNEVLDYSTEKWKKLNPFNTSSQELDLLFDINEWLDEHTSADLDLKNQLLSYKEVQQLSKQKLNLTLFQWKNHKLVNQARQTLYETGGSVKETTYALGFKDPAYFCRFFRNHTLTSPGEFVQKIEDKPGHTRLLKAFKSLLEQHVHQHHQLAFYANELSLTAKTLSRIIKSISGRSAKKHIDDELITKSKSLLQQGHSVTSIAFGLGFEELSHFSSFFKHHTGKNPSEELAKSTIQ